MKFAGFGREGRLVCLRLTGEEGVKPFHLELKAILRSRQFPTLGRPFGREPKGLPFGREFTSTPELRNKRIPCPLDK